MDVLMTCVRQLQPDYQLLAANLLLQLDTLVKSMTQLTFLVLFVNTIEIG